MEKVTAILIEKGDVYPQIVLERLTLGFFDEIIIETNCPSIYRRYELAAQAKNNILYVQDSDCMVNYQQLFKHYNGRITNAMTLPFQKKYEEMGCTLMGWGSFFPKSMLDVFVSYIERYGDDLTHLLREADRIFTYLNKPFNTIIMPHEDLPQGEDRMSSPKNYEFHMNSAAEALRKCSLL